MKCVFTSFRPTLSELQNGFLMLSSSKMGKQVQLEVPKRWKEGKDILYAEGWIVEACEDRVTALMIRYHLRDLWEKCAPGPWISSLREKAT